MMTKVISFGNFKGGTGKTTNSTMVAYELSNMGYKVLLGDLDPQANATDLLLLTKKRRGEFDVDKTMMTCLAEGSFKDSIVEIKENLFLLPSADDFSSYNMFLEQKFPNSDFTSRNNYFNDVLKEVKDDYDFIILDNPPSISIYTNSSLIASDYVIVVLQTQERSLTGAEAFVEYLNEFVNQNDLDLEVIGILPVLLKSDSIYDNSAYKNSVDIFGEENVFKNIVKNMERLKKYDSKGIIDAQFDELESDFHDTRVHNLYKTITEEMLERIDMIEKGEI
ncbi:hypothetical protein IGK74_002345 [Enterococcus sp. AZ150]|uniref:ParA family protein n=1 Tax=Enterococcus sp. AZ150 TaxID=2774866 RepID=UPI003F211624